MGANYSVIKTWVDAEVLTAADLNAEFQNVITNLTPSGVDDESVDITAMQATKDPYSGGTAQLPVSLQEEIQELRYMIKQITGKTYWYQDADSALVPTGAILLWSTDTAPTGFLMCTGQAVNRTTYATLFAVIGTTYGTGNGSTTFNVPDLRGRVPLGQDDMGGSAANRITDTEADTLGSSSGSESHLHTTGDVTLTAAQSGLPAHTHDITCKASNSQNPDGIVSGVNDISGTDVGTGAVTGGAQNASSAHNHGNTQTVDHTMPYLTLNYVIKT